MLESSIGSYETVDLPFQIGNYFNNVLKVRSKLRYFLPFDVTPERYLTITIQGIREVVFVHDDQELNQSITLIGMQMHNLKKIYGKEYLFTEPQLCIRPNPLIFELKVGILRRKEFCKRTKKRIMDWPTR